MTITVLPMDATAGAPAYSAKNARQAQAALYGNPTGRVFGTRSGWRVGTLSSIVSVTSTTWTLNPCACVIEPAASLYQGAYDWASDQVITGAMTAADGTNPRVDILYIQVNDNSAGDGSGLLSAPVSYLAGDPKPSGTQVAPALPARSFLVATIAVPKAGGGSPTVTLNSTYFVAAGGVLPIASKAERDALTPYKGFEIVRTDTPDQRREAWDGTIWQTPNGTSYTPTWAGPGSWGSGGSITGTYWQRGDMVTIRTLVTAGSGSTLPSTGGTPAGAVSFTLPPNLPMAAGLRLVGRGLWISPSGALRDLICIAAVNSTASLWVPKDGADAQTPGAAAMPWGSGYSFEALITYQTTTIL